MPEVFDKKREMYTVKLFLAPSMHKKFHALKKDLK